MKRRSFLSGAATIGATSLLPNVPEYLMAATEPYQGPQGTAKVPILVLATNWGFQGSHEEFCKKTKEAGYDGFEVWCPSLEAERNKVMESAAKYDLKVGFLAGPWTANFADHLKEYEIAIQQAVALKPLYVNTHAGKDFFTFEQNKTLLQMGINIGRQSGVPVLCETHRGRCAYNAPITKEYMDALKDLRLTADLSHWCVVHESMLEGFEDVLELALQRTHHIHARIGHAEGPQVNDPRAPEWAWALKTHLGWWDKVMAQAAIEKRPFQTFLCEFGPPHYLQALPYTQQPVADQWAINVHIMEMLRQRYK